MLSIPQFSAQACRSAPIENGLETPPVVPVDTYSKKEMEKISCHTRVANTLNNLTARQKWTGEVSDSKEYSIAAVHTEHHIAQPESNPSSQGTYKR